MRDNGYPRNRKRSKPAGLTLNRNFLAFKTPAPSPNLTSSRGPADDRGAGAAAIRRGMPANTLIRGCHKRRTYFLSVTLKWESPPFGRAEQAGKYQRIISTGASGRRAAGRLPSADIPAPTRMRRTAASAPRIRAVRAESAASKKKSTPLAAVIFADRPRSGRDRRCG